MQLWDMTCLEQSKLVAMHSAQIIKSNVSLQVNLTPKECPADLYTTVANMVMFNSPLLLTV